jgi:hypothetical protein
MGGIGSGNHGGKPTVEDGLVLDLNRLIQQGTFRPGHAWGGSIVWTEVSSGRQVATIGYEAHMGQESGWARLHYTTTDHWSGEKTHHDYRVELTTTPQPFGGRRWWWVCPRRGDLVSKLYKPNGRDRFASRKAHNIAYRSQRQSPHDRALGRAFDRRRQLGSTGASGDYIPKPKGMRWATFDREMERVQRAESIVNGHIWALLQRLDRRSKQ